MYAKKYPHKLCKIKCATECTWEYIFSLEKNVEVLYDLSVTLQR